MANLNDLSGGEDVGARRTAITQVAERWWACLPSTEEIAAWVGGAVPLHIIPEIRAEAVGPEGPLPVPIQFGINQHGTLLWKYMTQ